MEEELRSKLEQATTYEERAAIRRELRELRKQKQAGSTANGSAATAAAATAAVSSTTKEKKTHSKAAEKSESRKTTSIAPKRAERKPEEKQEVYTSKVETVHLKPTGRNASFQKKADDRPKPSRRSFDVSSVDGKEKQATDKDIQQGLAVYINRELASVKRIRTLLPVPSLGSGFYKTCSNPVLLCSLINLAVPNTIDVRALSSEPSGEASEENLTLALESARSIGCFVDSDTHSAVVEQKKSVILALLIDLLKARLVHSQGAEKLGRNLYDSPALLLGYYGIHI
ncbi:uncharacterized protein [Oscarella lobularis]|uniref:uncharacterized protein n=1 Tax=Oscarella lobularis TaxID=121494 RepID=UPI00331312BA